MHFIISQSHSQTIFSDDEIVKLLFLTKKVYETYLFFIASQNKIDICVSQDMTYVIAWLK